MSYEPFKDYLGLSSVAWERSYLDQLMAPPSCRPDQGASPINRELILPADPLDTLRHNAHADFFRNGVDNDLDDVDRYQTRLRNVSPPEMTSYPKSHTTSYPTSYPTAAAATTELTRRRKGGKKEKKACVFCRNNGEAATVFKSHMLKDEQGRTTCPILRRYKCPLCGAQGDSAHTIRYCPTNDGGLGSGLSLLLQQEIERPSSDSGPVSDSSEVYSGSSVRYCPTNDDGLVSRVRLMSVD